MKFVINKLILSLSVACLFAIASQAQQTKQEIDSAYLERCRKLRDSFRETGREFKAETIRDCEDKELINQINEGIEGYKNAATNEEKNNFMHWYIAKISCQQAIDFYQSVIISDTSAYIRGQVMLYLGWINAQSSIPFLLDYYRANPNLSTYEKVRIGTTLIALEAWDYGEQIVNENCFINEENIKQDCAFCYNALGNESSINYYRFMHKISGEGMNYIWALVHVGDKETAMPIIIEYMKSTNPGRKITLRMLEMIGDEESIEIIRSILDDNDVELTEEAKKTLNRIGINE